MPPTNSHIIIIISQHFNVAPPDYEHHQTVFSLIIW